MPSFSHAQLTDVTNKPSSDADIRQRLPGTWLFDSPGHYFRSTLTIASNGGYVCQLTVSNRQSIRTNELEGTYQVKDGILIDTITKSSITNEPVPLVFSNQIIRVNNSEFVYRRLDMGNIVVFRKDRK